MWISENVKVFSLLRRMSPTRARRDRAAPADATRLVEGDEPRGDELDVHLRGIDPSLLELRPQPVRLGQRRRTLHVDDDHAVAGGDVARVPADRLAERTRCRQRPGFALGVADGGNGRRGQRDADGDYHRGDGNDRVAAVDGPLLGTSRGGDLAVDAVDRHHDRTAHQDRGDVSHEEEGCSERLAQLTGLEGEANHAERGNERDGDGDARQGVGDVAAHQGDGADGTGGECRKQVYELRMDALGHLRVRLGDDWVDDKYSDQPTDGDRDDGAARDEEKRTGQVRPISEHDRKHRAEYWGHQGRDDHGPDHR